MNEHDIQQVRLVFKHKRDGDVKGAIFTLDDLIFGVGQQSVSDMIGFYEEDGYQLIRKDRFAGFFAKGKVPLFENDEVRITEDYVGEFSSTEILRVIFVNSAFGLTNDKDSYVPHVGEYLHDVVEIVKSVELFD